jgi:adenylosuccinate synthase
MSDNLYLYRKAHLILPTHKILDAASEQAKGNSKIGSTLKGIGPTYMDKTGRNGLRVGDLESPHFLTRYNALKEKHLQLLGMFDFEFQLDSLEKAWFNSLDRIRNLNLVDGEYYIHDIIADGKRILAEGAQGSMLDIDFGTYPFVTSSNTISAAVCTGLGIAPKHIGKVFGISKAYCTRVGSGPFPTELNDEVGERIRKEGGEFGATTGRPRRCGWIDLPALRYTIAINGVTDLVITKVDVLNNFDEIDVCTGYRINGKETDRLPFDLVDLDIEPIYKTFPGWNCEIKDMETFEELPEKLKEYLDFLSKELDTPITMMSYGPEREALICRGMDLPVSA